VESIKQHIINRLRAGADQRTRQATQNNAPPAADGPISAPAAERRAGAAVLGEWLARLGVAHSPAAAAGLIGVEARTVRRWLTEERQVPARVLRHLRAVWLLEQLAPGVGWGATLTDSGALDLAALVVEPAQLHRERPSTWSDGADL